MLLDFHEGRFPHLIYHSKPEDILHAFDVIDRFFSSYGTNHPGISRAIMPLITIIFGKWGANMGRLVVIGHGMAATRLVESLMDQDPKAYDIILIGEERYPDMIVFNCRQSFPERLKRNLLH